MSKNPSKKYFSVDGSYPSRDGFYIVDTRDGNYVDVIDYEERDGFLVIVSAHWPRNYTVNPLWGEIPPPAHLLIMEACQSVGRPELADGMIEAWGVISLAKIEYPLDAGLPLGGYPRVTSLPFTGDEARTLVARLADEPTKWDLSGLTMAVDTFSLEALLWRVDWRGGIGLQDRGASGWYRD